MLNKQEYSDLLIPLKEVYGEELYLSIRNMVSMPLDFKEEFMRIFIGKSLIGTPFEDSEETIDKFIIAVAVLGGWK